MDSLVENGRHVPQVGDREDRGQQLPLPSVVLAFALVSPSDTEMDRSGIPSVESNPSPKILRLDLRAIEMNRRDTSRA